MSENEWDRHTECPSNSYRSLFTKFPLTKNNDENFSPFDSQEAIDYSDFGPVKNFQKTRTAFLQSGTPERASLNPGFCVKG